MGWGGRRGRRNGLKNKGAHRKKKKKKKKRRGKESERNLNFGTQTAPPQPSATKRKKESHRRWKNYITHIYISIPEEILQTEIYHR